MGKLPNVLRGCARIFGGVAGVNRRKHLTHLPIVNRTHQNSQSNSGRPRPPPRPRNARSVGLRMGEHPRAPWLHMGWRWIGCGHNRHSDQRSGATLLGGRLGGVFLVACGVPHGGVGQIIDAGLHSLSGTDSSAINARNRLISATISSAGVGSRPSNSARGKSNKRIASSTVILRDPLIRAPHRL